MEAQWIKALKKNPEKNLDRLNDWLGVENWDEKVDGYEEKNSS